MSIILKTARGGEWQEFVSSHSSPTKGYERTMRTQRIIRGGEGFLRPHDDIDASASPLVPPPCFPTPSSPLSRRSPPAKRPLPQLLLFPTPPPSDSFHKPPTAEPKSTTKPPPPMRPRSRPIHLWQPSVWDASKPFYDWCDPKNPPDHPPLPHDWAFEHIRYSPT